MSALNLLSLVLVLLGVACFCLVLVHAFQRSLGTGFMVLCIPCYQLYYGFSQFEHPRKGLILAGWVGMGTLGVILRRKRFG